MRIFNDKDVIDLTRAVVANFEWFSTLLGMKISEKLINAVNSSFQLFQWSETLRIIYSISV